MNNRRIAILLHVSMAEWSVGDLAKEMSLSQSALSQHLAKLRHHRLVEYRKDGRRVLYSCSTKKVDQIRAILNAGGA